MDTWDVRLIKFLKSCIYTLLLFIICTALIYFVFRVFRTFIRVHCRLRSQLLRGTADCTLSTLQCATRIAILLLRSFNTSYEPYIETQFIRI